MILRHLTINTGHERLSHRSEIHDQDVDALLPVVDADAGTNPETGWTITILHRSPGWCAWQIGPYRTPYIIAVTCWDDDAATGAWSYMPALAKAAVVAPDWTPPECPAAPWLAVVFTPFIRVLPPEEIEAMASIESTVAWAIIESN